MTRLRAAALAAAAVGAALVAAPAASGASVLAELPAGADARDIARDNGVTLARAFPQIGWAEYELPAAAPAAARARLLDDGRVSRLDFQRRGEELEPQFTPNDTYTVNPRAFISDGVRTNYYLEQARLYTAWDLGRGSLGTRVAVIDDEIDQTHPDLAPNVVPGYNAERQFPATHRGGDTRASTQQVAADELHGTHVAGLAAAATNNALGISGAGFDADLMPVKITLTIQAPETDATFLANAIEGITWAADNGADVINMSFGSPTAYPTLADAVAYAASKDVLLVAAAGNNQDDPPATRGEPLYPAAFDDVLAVGATDSNGVITSFSTNGDYVDAAAPGSRILSTWDPRVLTSEPEAGYAILSGTSMASPLVAGLGALIRDVRPDLPAGQVEAIIMATASDRGVPGRDDVYGAGLINAEAALREAGGAALAPAAAPAAPPAAAAPAPATPAPLRRRTRLVYRCSIGDARVPTGAARPVGVDRGRSLVCRGRTLPGLGNARVKVQRLVKGRWTGIGSSRTTVSGRFGFRVSLKTTGRWTVRAALAPTPAVAPAAGVRVSLAVARPR